MGKKYKIIYLPLFYDDLNKMIDYIKYELNNEITANNLINEIEKVIIQRAYSPECYEKYISSNKRKSIYYRIYIKNYSIFYTIKDDNMEVRRILSSRRNFGKLI